MGCICHRTYTVLSCLNLEIVTEYALFTLLLRRKAAEPWLVWAHRYKYPHKPEFSGDDERPKPVIPLHLEGNSGLRAFQTGHYLGEGFVNQPTPRSQHLGQAI